jgi:hypothetical protein
MVKSYTLIRASKMLSTDMYRKLLPPQQKIMKGTSQDVLKITDFPLTFKMIIDIILPE